MRSASCFRKSFDEYVRPTMNGLEAVRKPEKATPQTIGENDGSPCSVIPCEFQHVSRLNCSLNIGDYL